MEAWAEYTASKSILVAGTATRTGVSPSHAARVHLLITDARVPGMTFTPPVSTPYLCAGPCPVPRDGHSGHRLGPGALVWLPPTWRWEKAGRPSVGMGMGTHGGTGQRRLDLEIRQTRVRRTRRHKFRWMRPPRQRLPDAVPMPSTPCAQVRALCLAMGILVTGWDQGPLFGCHPLGGGKKREGHP